MSYQIHPIYIREMPQTEELEALSNAQLEMFIKTLQDELSLVQEETVALTNYSQSRRAQQQGAGLDGGMFGGNDASDPSSGGGGGILPDGYGTLGNNEDDVTAIAASVAAPVSTKTGGGKRKGRTYQRKSSEERVLILSVDDKMTIIAEEHDRVKGDTQQAKESALESRELMQATRSEAENRISELALAETYFHRDVVAGDSATSMDRVNSYIADRPGTYHRQVTKIDEKNAMMHQQIRKLEQQLDTTGDAGDKFIRIDFDQLKIENQQYTERLTDKEKELKQLKTTTTRTVQTLNGLTDRLNQFLTEQANSTRDLQVRRDHSRKLEKELKEVRGSGVAARTKNTSLKIQHESVKVPKVEEYIAQKAEEHELKKAVGNWRRKVEIARGHVHVMKQKSKETKKMSMAAAEARSALLLPGGSGNVRAMVGSLRGGANSSNNNNNIMSGLSPSGRTMGVEAIPAPPPAAASSGMRSSGRRF